MKIELIIEDINEIPILRVENYLIQNIEKISIDWETSNNLNNGKKEVTISYFEKEVKKTINLKSLL